MTEIEIKADLWDLDKKDNQRLANLLDEGRWQQLISQYDEGRGEKTIEELLEDLVEGR